MALEKYLVKKTTEIQIAESLGKEIEGLNYRQLAVLSNAIRKTGTTFTVNSHKVSHQVAYATARADLLNLVKRGLLEQWTVGNAMNFRSGPVLNELMEKSLESEQHPKT